MGWFFFWIICGVAACAVAVNKNKSGGKWFLLGLLLGPFALLMVGFSPADPVRETKFDDRGLRKCPYCAEAIKAEAVVCKHCGRDVPPQDPDPDIGSAASDNLRFHG